jgi:hypothetical protein
MPEAAAFLTAGSVNPDEDYCDCHRRSDAAFLLQKLLDPPHVFDAATVSALHCNQDRTCSDLVTNRGIDFAGFPCTLSGIRSGDLISAPEGAIACSIRAISFSNSRQAVVMMHEPATTLNFSDSRGGQPRACLHAIIPNYPNKEGAGGSSVHGSQSSGPVFLTFPTLGSTFQFVCTEVRLSAH